MQTPPNPPKHDHPAAAFTLIELRKEFSIFESRFSIGRYCAKAMRHQWFDYSKIENPKSKIHHASRGFTLIELLTVIAIIGILAAITLAAVSRVRAQAQQARCGSNIRQIAALAAVWAQDNQDWTPQAMWGKPKSWFVAKGMTGTASSSYTPNLTWIGLSPALGTCGSVADDTEPPHYGINRDLVPGPYTSEPGATHYYKHGLYKFSAILSSRTILFAETQATASYGTGLNGARTAAYAAFHDSDTSTSFATRHSNRGHLAYADGHIALKTLQQIRKTNNPNPWREGLPQ